MFFTLLIILRLITNSSGILIDQLIIEECKKGDLQNFRQIIEKASPFAFSVALKILGDEELAKDVVQETMVTVWEKLGKINSAGSFKTWLYRITVNKCYDQLRRMKRVPEFRPDEKTWAAISNHISEQPSTEIDNEEVNRIMSFMIQNLGPKQKSVFVLSEIEQMSNEEISEITGMSKTLIKANLYYARKQVLGLIKKYL